MGEERGVLDRMDKLACTAMRAYDGERSASGKAGRGAVYRGSDGGRKLPPSDRPKEIVEKGKIAVIHQYRNNGYNIVMDVNSGSVHVVDDCVYEVLPAVEQLLAPGNRDRQSILDAVLKGGYHFEEQELSEAVDEILELAEAAQLFTEDIYEK